MCNFIYFVLLGSSPVPAAFRNCADQVEPQPDKTSFKAWGSRHRPNAAGTLTCIRDLTHHDSIQHNGTNYSRLKATRVPISKAYRTQFIPMRTRPIPSTPHTPCIRPLLPSQRRGQGNLILQKPNRNNYVLGKQRLVSRNKAYSPRNAGVNKDRYPERRGPGVFWLKVGKLQGMTGRERKSQ